jgi:hypothetical protein
MVNYILILKIAEVVDWIYLLMVFILKKVDRSCRWLSGVWWLSGVEATYMYFFLFLCLSFSLPSTTLRQLTAP